MTNQLDQDVQTLNSLLRGELAAIESYAYVLSRFEGQLYQTVLRQIHREHEEAAALLRGMILDRDAEPEADSGVWGYFTTAVAGGAQLFGVQTTLAALIRGERYAARSYQDAIDNQVVSDECLELISNQLLPVTLLHLDRLSHMLGSSI
jgi:hypothetical protein